MEAEAEVEEECYYKGFKSSQREVESQNGVDSPTIKPNIEAYVPQNSESGSYVVVRWRHTVNLKQTTLKTNKHLGVSLCQLRHGREKT
jgi:hypothetical protein